MLMSFGKHRGVALPDVDAGYLAWLLPDAEDGRSRTDLKEAVAAELRRRIDGVAGSDAVASVADWASDIADQLEAARQRITRFLRVIDEAEVHHRNDPKALLVLRWVRERLP